MLTWTSAKLLLFWRSVQPFVEGLSVWGGSIIFAFLSRQKSWSQMESKLVWCTTFVTNQTFISRIQICCFSSLSPVNVLWGKKEGCVILGQKHSVIFISHKGFCPQVTLSVRLVTLPYAYVFVCFCRNRSHPVATTCHDVQTPGPRPHRMTSRTSVTTGYWKPSAKATLPRSSWHDTS